MPVVSYAVLRGRCRYCGWRIPARYPLIELFSGLWAVFSVYNYGLSLTALESFVFFCFVVVVSFIDMDSMVVMDRVVFLGSGVGVLFHLVLNGFSLGPLMWYLAGLGIAWGIIGLIRIVSRGGMGDGDSYIALMVASFLDFKLTVLMLFLSFVVGGIVGVLLLLMKRKGRKDALPFGPFLGVGGMLAYLCGNFIIRWYVNFFSL